MRSIARKIKKIKVKESGNDLQEEQVDVDDLDDEKDTTVAGILNRLRYQRDSVTATEWSSLYDMRLKNIKKLKKTGRIEIFTGKMDAVFQKP